ncbi:VWA domain-containing protein [Brevibacterium gallinarum]|uniref:PT domain-containing protein n=1 Tax=Brevibacterium gallinarum TaxID=2762220 RepID=A0ABR8WW36_9MICO|nr:PT domain-containing protein [Brevibacterium gallinarum]MBD8021168.1 PT domain-containing protein [Brevibacterium gallinarum]
MLDLSNSLTDADVEKSKEAAKGVVDTLTGTPSSVGVQTFATFAPAGNNADIPVTGIAEAGNAADVKNRIDGLTRPASNDGGTNWDRGIAQAQGKGYDAVFFVTDGKPTAYGTPGEGNNTDRGAQFDQIDLDTAITSANGVKGEGTKMVGIAVGSDPTVENIVKISGPNENSDYYSADDYDQLGERLRQIAAATCEGSVTVLKKTQIGEAAPEPAEGWDFTATNADPAQATTNENGVVNFAYDDLVSRPSVDTTISETLKDDFTLRKQDGKNAVCHETNGDEPVEVPVENAGETGFSLSVKREQIVTCTVVNWKAGDDPTEEPTDNPTETPTEEPSQTPTGDPSDQPSDKPGDDDSKNDDARDDDGSGRDSDHDLPRTGSEVGMSVGFGLALLATGAATVALTRRNRA